jgi:hypothetical protein
MSILGMERLAEFSAPAACFSLEAMGGSRTIARDMASDRIFPAPQEEDDDRGEEARLRKLAAGYDSLFPPGEARLTVAEAQAFLEDAAFLRTVAETLSFQTEAKRKLWIENLPSRIKTEAGLAEILRTFEALPGHHRDYPHGDNLAEPEVVELTCATALAHALKCWTEQGRKSGRKRKDRQRKAAPQAPDRAKQAKSLRDKA